MSVIVLDGPEKAGKTTFARLIQKQDPRVRYRHWGPVRNHVEYLGPLLGDVASPYPVIWDRSWASEWVYGNLLNRGGELVTDPFLGEWLYGRLAVFNGVRIVVAPSADVLAVRRLEEPDAGDLPVDPANERQAYVDYADRWGWSVFTRTEAEQARAVLDLAWRRLPPPPYGGIVNRAMTPDVYVGPRGASLVFLGDEMNPNDQYSLPFSSDFTTRYGRALGPSALKCGWTNAADADPGWLRGRTVVACGQRAVTWAYKHRLDYHGFPHPSYLYRWGKVRDSVPTVEEQLRTLVEGVAA